MVNDAVEQNEAGDAAYQRALEIAKEIIPNVSNCTYVSIPWQDLRNEK